MNSLLLLLITLLLLTSLSANQSNSNNKEADEIEIDSAVGPEGVNRIEHQHKDEKHEKVEFVKVKSSNMKDSLDEKVRKLLSEDGKQTNEERIAVVDTKKVNGNKVTETIDVVVEDKKKSRHRHHHYHKRNHKHHSHKKSRHYDEDDEYEVVSRHHHGANSAAKSHNKVEAIVTIDKKEKNGKETKQTIDVVVEGLKKRHSRRHKKVVNLCGPGTFMSRAGLCYSCPKGKDSRKGATKCVDAILLTPEPTTAAPTLPGPVNVCGSGTFFQKQADNSTLCVKCPLGFTSGPRATVCIKDLDYVAPVTVAPTTVAPTTAFVGYNPSPNNCGPGTYFHTGYGVCKRCPKGETSGAHSYSCKKIDTSTSVIISSGKSNNVNFENKITKMFSYMSKNIGNFGN